MRGYEQSLLESEFALPEWEIELDTEWETDPDAERRKRLRQQRSLRRQALARIAGLIIGGPLPMPALPQERPAIVAEDPRRRGGQGSREAEAELVAVRTHHPEARLMEQLGRLATRTDNDAEAEALVGALVPLAARVVPRAEPALMCAASRLAPGLSGAARVLREHRATRPLVRRLPTVARRTALVLGRRAALAQPTTPEIAARALVRQAVRVLSEDGPGRAERMLGTGSTPVTTPIIERSPRYPQHKVDDRTAGTGGIEKITFDINAANQQVVTIYGKILPQTGRHGLENTLRPADEIPALSGRNYQRAHLWEGSSATKRQQVSCMLRGGSTAGGSRNSRASYER